MIIFSEALRKAVTVFDGTSVARLNEIVLPLLRRRVAEIGETDSGAYNFYMTRLKHGSIVSDYEIALVKLFLERGLGTHGVHEVGAGFGQLPFLFALNGIAAVAIELDRRRIPTAELMHAALRAAVPDAGARVRVINGAFPLPHGTLPPSNAVVLATNMIYTTTPEGRRQIVDAMAAYRVAVVDVDRLFEKRTDDDGRQQSIRVMNAAGFGTPTPLLDLGDSGHYFMFRSGAAALNALPLIRANRSPTAPMPMLSAPTIATATLVAMRPRLADRIRRRAVTRIVYFHTDHFEPWRTFDGRKVFGPENARDLEQFAAAMSKLEFGRKLTLFAKPHLNFALRRDVDTMHATDDDEIGFMRRTPSEDAAARAALRPIVETTLSEFQLHVHHENYTSNATVTVSGTDIGQYLATPKGAALDSQRFAFAVQEALKILAHETGRSFERWFFIHGHWALNASDDADCRIVDEISLLHRLGCRGDFTCPAGRSHVDPRHQVPYLCRPVDVPKGYDTREAQPTPLAGAGAALAEQRFLVWASKIKHGATSIDHSSEFVRRRGRDLESAAGKLIDQSYVHDGTLYVKTHAHAMHPAYSDGRAARCFPHLFPTTHDLLALTFDAGADAGAEVLFETASEVYRRLAHSPTRARDDLSAAFGDASGGNLIGRLAGWSRTLGGRAGVK